MTVNNELGTVQPVEEIGALVKGQGNILFHTDAVQAFGKVPVDPGKWNADLVTVSSHKIHGPKGIGALYIRKGIHIEPYIYCGGQERGMRSGTENTPGIAGFGLAAEMAHNSFRERVQAMEKARKISLEGIKAEIPDVTINSPEAVFSANEKDAEMADCNNQRTSRHNAKVGTGRRKPNAKAKSRKQKQKNLRAPYAARNTECEFSGMPRRRCCSTPWSSRTFTCPPAPPAPPRKREAGCWRRPASPPLSLTAPSASASANSIQWSRWTTFCRVKESGFCHETINAAILIKKHIDGVEID